MPPRFVYWTIIAGGLPTAFRATEQEELLPTFQRLKEKHPDAEMKYFAQGKLWDSPVEAKAARDAARAGERPEGPPRGRSWRPGGEHKDPRQKYLDQKKERNLRWRDEKFEKKQRFEAKAGGPPRFPKVGDAGSGFSRKDVPPGRPTGPASARGGGDPWKARPPKRDWQDRPPKKDFGDRPAAPRGDWRDKPRGDWREKKPFEKRPFEARGDRPRAPRADHDPRSGPSGAGAPPRERFDRPKGDWSDRPRAPKGEWTDRPRAPKDEWQARPPKREWQDRPPREDWRDKKTTERRPFEPRGDRPSSDRPRAPKAHDPKSGPAGAPAKRAWSDRPPKPEWKDRPAKPEWKSRPPREGSGPRDDRPKRPFNPRGRKP